MEEKKWIYIGDLLLPLKKNGLIRIVFEDGFNSSSTKHPIENHLRENGVPYYFKGDPIEKSSDYEINLNNLNIFYSK